MKDADVFLGLSMSDVMTSGMLKSMKLDPIGSAMANTNPEISYENAISTRKDIIFETGASDSNQLNNVLGIPLSTLHINTNGVLTYDFRSGGR